MFVRSYLRASTDKQDATRARAAVEAFAVNQGHSIACEYVENASGTKADRPELLRLLKDAKPGDVLLVESIDRLSRLPTAEWQHLKGAMTPRACASSRSTCRPVTRA